MHSLCGVLGMDFKKIVEEVHPSLHEACAEQSTNISDTTLEGLAQAILKLKTEKKIRTEKVNEVLIAILDVTGAICLTIYYGLQLRDATKSLLELWKLMDSSGEERRPFEKVINAYGSLEVDAKCSVVLSFETIKQVWQLV